MVGYTLQPLYSQVFILLEATWAPVMIWTWWKEIPLFFPSLPHRPASSQTQILYFNILWRWLMTEFAGAVLNVQHLVVLVDCGCAALSLFDINVTSTTCHQVDTFT
jgi:hypothetical protein